MAATHSSPTHSSPPHIDLPSHAEEISLDGVHTDDVKSYRSSTSPATSSRKSIDHFEHRQGHPDGGQVEQNLSPTSSRRSNDSKKSSSQKESGVQSPTSSSSSLENFPNEDEGTAQAEQEGVKDTPQESSKEISQGVSSGVELSGKGPSTPLKEDPLEGKSELLVAPILSQDLSKDSEAEKKDILMSRSEVYLRLKDWEEDHATRTEKFHWLLDSLVDELGSGALAARETNTNVIKFVKDRQRLSSEFSNKLRSSTSLSSLKQNLRPQSSRSIVPGPDLQGPPSTPPTSSIGSEITATETATRPPPGSSLHLFPPPWLKGLFRCMDKETAYLASFSEALETSVLQGTSLPPTLSFELLSGKLGVLEDYEKAVTSLMSKLREARSQLWAQNKEVRKGWIDFQRVFKEVEKSRFSTEEAPVSKPKESPTSSIFRDTWLSERKYLHSVLTVCKMQHYYLELLIQGVNDMRRLEQWRASVVKEALLIYTNRLRETLGLFAANLGAAHQLIDPLNFSKAKAEFLARESKSSDSQDSTPHDSTVSLEKTASSNGRLVRSGADASTETLEKTSKVLFDSAQDLLANIKVPESQLVIKKGLVRRLAGLWGKWSDGLLVLTWDRILHMFRSFDDVQPVWSTYIPVVEIRLVEDRTGVKTVEIRDKRNLLGVLGAKNLYFRTFTDDELSSWLKCLSLASTADSKTYRVEGLLSAQSADQKALRDYNQWIKSHETLSGDVLYGEDLMT